MITIQDFCEVMNKVVKDSFGNFAIAKKEEGTGREYIEFQVFVGSWDFNARLCKVYWDDFETDIIPGRVTGVSSEQPTGWPWTLDDEDQEFILPSRYEDIQDYLEEGDYSDDECAGVFTKMKELDKDSPLLESYCRYMLEIIYKDLLERMCGDGDLIITYYEGIQNIIGRHRDIMKDIREMLMEESYTYV